MPSAAGCAAQGRAVLLLGPRLRARPPRPGSRPGSVSTPPRCRPPAACCVSMSSSALGRRLDHHPDVDRQLGRAGSAWPRPRHRRAPRLWAPAVDVVLDRRLGRRLGARRRTARRRRPRSWVPTPGPCRAVGPGRSLATTTCCSASCSAPPATSTGTSAVGPGRRRGARPSARPPAGGPSTYCSAPPTAGLWVPTPGPCRAVGPGRSLATTTCCSASCSAPPATSTGTSAVGPGRRRGARPSARPPAGGPSTYCSAPPTAGLWVPTPGPCRAVGPGRSLATTTCCSASCSAPPATSTGTSAVGPAVDVVLDHRLGAGRRRGVGGHLGRAGRVDVLLGRGPRAPAAAPRLLSRPLPPRCRPAGSITTSASTAVGSTTTMSTAPGAGPSAAGRVPAGSAFSSAAAVSTAGSCVGVLLGCGSSARARTSAAGPDVDGCFGVGVVLGRTGVDGHTAMSCSVAGRAGGAGRRSTFCSAAASVSAWCSAVPAPASPLGLVRRAGSAPPVDGRFGRLGRAGGRRGLAWRGLGPTGCGPWYRSRMRGCDGEGCGRGGCYRVW